MIVVLIPRPVDPSNSPTKSSVARTLGGARQRKYAASVIDARDLKFYAAWPICPIISVSCIAISSSRDRSINGVCEAGRDFRLIRYIARWK